MAELLFVKGPETLNDGYVYEEEARAILAAACPYTLGDRLLIGRNQPEYYREQPVLQLLSPYVNRYHARITRTADGYVFEDRRSSTGSWVNGSRVDAPVGLRDGDVIRLGGFTLVFRDSPS